VPQSDETIVLRLKSVGASDASADIRRVLNSIKRLRAGAANAAAAMERQSKQSIAAMREQEKAARVASVSFGAATATGQAYASAMGAVGTGTRNAVAPMSLLTKEVAKVDSTFRAATVSAGNFSKAASASATSYVGMFPRSAMYGNELNKAEAELKKAEAGVNALSMRWLALGYLSSRVAGVIIKGLKSITDAQYEYSKALVFAQNTINATAEQTEAMKEAVAGMPSLLGSTAELMAGLGKTMTAGFREPAEAVRVLTAAASAAASTSTDLEIAVNAVTSAMQAYGASADDAYHYTDVMLKAVDLGKITFGEYASTIGNVVTVAADTGVRIEELTTAVAVLTKRGMPAAQAMTAIRSVLLRMLKPVGDQAKAFDDLGVSYSKAKFEQEGFIKSLIELKRLADEKGYTTFELFPQFRSMKGAAGLLGDEGIKDLLKILDQLDAAGGKTARNLETYSKSYQGSVDYMTNSLRSFLQDWGEVAEKLAGPVAKALGDTLEQTRTMYSPVKKAAQGVFLLEGSLLGVAAAGGSAFAAMKWVNSMIIDAKLYKYLGMTADGFSLATKHMAKFTIGISAAAFAASQLAAWLDTLNILSEEYKNSLEDSVQTTITFQKALKDSGVSAQKFLKKTGIAIGDLVSNLEEAKKAYETLSADKANEFFMEDRLVKLGKAYEKYKKQIEGASEAVKKSREEQKKADKSAEELEDTLKTLGVTVEEQKSSVDLLREAFEGLSKSQETLTDKTFVAIAQATTWSEINEERNRIVQSVVASTEKEVKATEKQVEVQANANRIMKEGAAVADDLAKALAEMESVLTDAVSEAIGAAIRGSWDDVSKAWEDLWEDLGNMLGDILTDILKDTLKDTIKAATEGGGTFDPSGWVENMSPLQRGAMGVGGLMGMYQASQTGGKTGVIGGLISGAMAGTAINPGLGTAIGAVIGGLLGFLGGGGEDQKQVWARMSFNPSTGVTFGAGPDENLSGFNPDAFERELNNVIREIHSSYLDAFEILGDPSIFSKAMLEAFDWGEQVMNDDEMKRWLDELAKGWIPGQIQNQMWDAIVGTIRESFKRVGIESLDEESFFGNYLDEIEGLDTEGRLEYFTNLVKALNDLGDVVEQMDFSNVMDLASMSGMDAFKAGITDIAGSVDVLFARMKAELDLGAAAADADKIAQYLQTGAEYVIQMARQVKQLADAIDFDVKSKTEQLQLVGKGTDYAFGYYQEQMRSLLDEMAKTTDPTQLSQLYTRYSDYYSKMFDILSSVKDFDWDSLVEGSDLTWREWMQSWVNAGKAASDEAIGGMESYLKEATDYLREAAIAAGLALAEFAKGISDIDLPEPPSFDDDDEDGTGPTPPDEGAPPEPPAPPDDGAPPDSSGLEEMIRGFEQFIESLESLGENLSPLEQLFSDLEKSDIAIGNLMEKLRTDESMEDAAASAGLIYKYLTDSADAIISMMSQIDSIMEGITGEADSRRESLLLQGKSDDWIFKYYQDQMDQLRGKMESATSPEEVQKYYQEYIGYWDKIFAMLQDIDDFDWDAIVPDPDAGGRTWREWMEYLLGAGEEGAKDVLGDMKDDLQEAIDGLIDYAEEVEGILDGFDEEVTTSEGIMKTMNTSVTDATTAVDAFTDSLGLASAGTGRDIHSVLLDALDTALSRNRPIIEVTGSIAPLIAIIDRRIADWANPANNGWG